MFGVSRILNLRGARRVRIAEQADAILQFVDQQELRPGRELEITDHNALAGLVQARLDNGRAISLGLAAAAKIEFEVE